MPRPTNAEIKQSVDDYVNSPEVNQMWNAEERLHDIEFSAAADAERHGGQPDRNDA